MAEKLTELVKEAFEISGIESLDAISGRSGFLPRPNEKLAGGTYLVAENVEGKLVINDTIVNAVIDSPEMEHASNLGIIVAANLAKHFNVPEFSGYAPITRHSTSHALSIRATTKKAAEIAGRSVDDINLVIAHLGGGMTIASVVKGKMTDNNIALLGEGPFTPQRSGQLPTNELIDLCYSRQFTKKQLKSELSTKAGLVSYLDTNSMNVIEERIEQGDEKAKLAVEAMVYQIAKNIGSAFVAADCTAEAIVLTGGLARSAYITKSIRQRVGRLAPVIVCPGSVEMSALADGAIAVLAGTQKALKYNLYTKK